jgi:nucleoside-triphosphatase
VVKNILFTGKPKSGKTTLLRKIIAQIPNKVGFVTNEMRKDVVRVGFEIETHAGEKSVLAHVDFDKSLSVGKYGLNLDNLNKLLPSVEVFENEVLYLDEIGQMELQSQDFVQLARKYLDAKNICLATLTSVYEDGFTKEVRRRDDVTIYEITEENRDNLYEEILRKLR